LEIHVDGPVSWFHGVLFMADRESIHGLDTWREILLRGCDACHVPVRG
jgi:hypothetical protein